MANPKIVVPEDQIKYFSEPRLFEGWAQVAEQKIHWKAIHLSTARSEEDIWVWWVYPDVPRNVLKIRKQLITAIASVCCQIFEKHGSD